jgi:phosphomannomutase / phosphoglucomutase
MLRLFLNTIFVQYERLSCEYFCIKIVFFNVPFTEKEYPAERTSPAPMRTPIDHKIFRAYDIRGRAGTQIDEHACRMVGQAFGSELRERYDMEHPTVCVGRDARVTGPAFEEAVIEGLLAAGCIVVRIGQTPSPVNYFTVCARELDGSVQVTASHNPAHDNGLKLSLRHAEAIAGDDLQELRERIEAGNLLEGEGSEETIDAVADYLDVLSSTFGRCAEGMTIVVDGGNGVAGPAYCEALRRAGAEVIELYTEPDGNFPNHPADPSKHATLKDLQRVVLENEADMGLAFDGDGDRIGIVDETGAIRTPDEILLLLAKDHLSRFPGAPVVFTVSNSGILDSEIRAMGGVPIMSKVGHSFVEHAMLEHESLLGGEQSGHMFCGENYFPYDDALVAGLRVLNIVNESDSTFGELCDEFPEVHQAPERRPTVPDEHKGKVIQDVTQHFSKAYPTITLDGVRIDFGDGAWAGIRQSNTSPCISICIEARSPEKLKEVEEIVLGHIAGYDVVDLASE